MQYPNNPKLNLENKTTYFVMRLSALLIDLSGLVNLQPKNQREMSLNPKFIIDLSTAGKVRLGLKSAVVCSPSPQPRPFFPVYRSKSCLTTSLQRVCVGYLLDGQTGGSGIDPEQTLI